MKVKVTRMENNLYKIEYEDGVITHFQSVGCSTTIEADIEAVRVAQGEDRIIELSNGVDSVTLGEGIFSIASHEFIVTHQDGTKESIWSGPWNDYTPEEELAHALEAVEKGQVKSHANQP